MALKTNFEDASFLASPFVDEIANPGDSPAEVERQAVRSNQLRLQHGQSAADFNKKTKAPESTPASAPAADTSFLGTLKARKDKTDKLSAR